jgi:hypothetical protein
MRSLRLTMAAAILGTAAAVAFAAPSHAYVQPAGPSLAITLTASPATVAPGKPVTLTATITNLTLLRQVTTGTIKVIPAKPMAVGAASFRFPIDVAAQATQTIERIHTVPLGATKGTYSVTLTVPGAAAPVVATFTVG